MASMREVHLSWKYLKKTIGKGRDGQNLVLHEFAHVIDFSDDGKAQSIPVPRTSKDYEFWEKSGFRYACKNCVSPLCGN